MMDQFKPFLTKDQMSKLSTKRLLAYFRKELNFGRDCENSWCGYEGCEKKCSRGAYHQAFHEARAETKAILACREHVERRKEKRHGKATTGQRRPI